MKIRRALILALPLAGLLAGCSGWAAEQDIKILKSDPDGIVIQAGTYTTPDRTAIVYCQSMRKLMVPKGADIVSPYQKIYYYACL